jgi:SnoaL-like domain
MFEHAEQEAVLQPPVSEWIVAFNTRNLEAIVGLYADDAELLDTGMRRPRRGKKEIESWFRLRFSSMPENVYTPRDGAVMEEGRAVVPWTLYGRGPRLLGQSWLARPFQVDGTSYFTLQESLIYRQHGIYDHRAVLRQILPPLRRLPAFVTYAIYYLYLWRNRQL